MRYRASLGACALGVAAMVILFAALRGATLAAMPVVETAYVQVGPGDVVVNEVAWSGTEADPCDEWIELHNVTSLTVALEGWTLVDDDAMNASLSGEIPPDGYYLIERTDDDAVADIAADWFGSFGTGGLDNAGAVLTLTDDLGAVIDTVNVDGGEWPGGTASDEVPSYASMERIDPLAPGNDDNWCTNDGLTRNGEDKDGNPINGTPKAQNSCYQSPGLPGPVATVHLPLIFRAYVPPRCATVIEAVLYDGLQPEDYDEAVLLFNGQDVAVNLNGWSLCKWTVSDWRCADLPAVTMAPGERTWLARNDLYFARSFGFLPDHVLSSWPRFTNTGDEVVLLDGKDVVKDALVYEADLINIDGWEGPAVEPYLGTSFALEGQILYRYPAERSGVPLIDTDSAADWAQYRDDLRYGRRVRYPGWDLERFFKPALGASGTVTAGIAPDNAYPLVVEAIRSAEERIDIEAYTLEHDGLVMELVEQAKRGVKVTVLLEGGPVGGIDDQELWACQALHDTGHGVCAFMVNAPELDIHDRYSYLHAKVIIVDRKRVLIGSQNLTHSGIPDDDKSNGTGGSRGVVLVTDAPEIVSRAAEVFEADYDPKNHADIVAWGSGDIPGYGPPPSGFTPDQGQDWVSYSVQFSETVRAEGTGFELVTGPETTLRSDDSLLGLLARAGAGDAVFVEQMYETEQWGRDGAPNPRLQAYVDAARRGARVRILLNGGDLGAEYLSVAQNAEVVADVNEIAEDERLDLGAGLGDPTRYGIHNKMVLADLGAEGRYAHVGSINGSETSNKVSREMALQVRSETIFDYLYAMFEYDWEHRLP